MARPRSTIPAYRKHKNTGRAVVSYYRADGTRTETILSGKYGSRESKAEFERLLSQLRANEGQMPTDLRQDLTISELVLKFLEHAKKHYVDPTSKEPTSEMSAISAAVKPFLVGERHCTGHNPRTCFSDFPQSVTKGAEDCRKVTNFRHFRLVQ